MEGTMDRAPAPEGDVPPMTETPFDAPPLPGRKIGEEEMRWRREAFLKFFEVQDR